MSRVFTLKRRKIASDLSVSQFTDLVLLNWLKSIHALALNVAQLFCQQIQVNETQFDCVWLAWVLMPDHFHGLVRLESDQSSLSSVIRSLKGSSDKQINRSLMKQGRLWQPSFYDRALRRDEDRKNIARYIVANPLRKGLVKSIRNYPYWNAIYL